MDDFEPYNTLSPDDILNAVETIGYQCDGRINALNSYENRVYQIGIEDKPPLIAKFYRPQRWTDAAIIEEHEFSRLLSEHEIPVIAPVVDAHGASLFHADSFRFALYPRVGGRSPELDNPDHLQQLGRTLARLHAIGEVSPFQHRATLSVTLAAESRDFVLSNNFIPADLEPAYSTLSRDLVEQIESSFSRADKIQNLRIHGDCHLGNILWNEDAPFLVDFDDACMGPAIQDLWMLLSGERDYMTARLYDLLDGYCQFREFDPRELQLVEALRTLRMINYAAWIARRWHDPAFPMAFPWFNTQQYWQDHILALREQAALMQEPPLQWEPE